MYSKIVFILLIRLSWAISTPLPFQELQSFDENPSSVDMTDDSSILVTRDEDKIQIYMKN